MNLPGSKPKTEFDVWACRWMTLANYRGAEVPDIAARIDGVLELWHEQVPGDWKRGADHRLLRPGCCYTRGNLFGLRRGEHKIEYEMLSSPLENVACLGVPVADGVNAVPL